MLLEDDVLYTKSTIFYKGPLLTLILVDISCFFSLQAFGTSVPNTNSEPTCGRPSSLESYKKEINYFMSFILIGWSVQEKQGNHTKSVAVNNLIKKV